MNFSFIRDNIQSFLLKKYKGKFKDFAVEDFAGDISQILVGMIKRKEIESFENLKVYKTNDGISVYANVFIKFGKIQINMKVAL